VTQLRSCRDTTDQADPVRKLIRLSIVQILLIFVALGWLWGGFNPSPAVAQEAGALVRPDPLVFEVGLGQVETLQIVMENAINVYGIDVRANFDFNAVEIYDSDANRDGIQMLPGTFPQPDFVVINNADNQAGALQYVLTQVNPTLPANGNGLVLSIQILGKLLGETPFTITYVETADREGYTLVTTSQDGVIRVVPARPPTPTPVTPQQSAVEVTQVIPTEASVSIRVTEEAAVDQDPGALQPLQSLATPTNLVQNRSNDQREILTYLAAIGFVGAASMLFIAAVVFYRRRSDKAK
jgi:hypothetical protein